MKKLALSVLALALVASHAAAQPPGGGRGGGFGRMNDMMLLAVPSVQQELKLTDEQVRKIQERGQRAFQGFQGFQGLSREEIQARMEEMRKETEKFLSETLTTDQQKRLREIALQVAIRNFGMVAALSNPETAQKLGITEDQREDLRRLAEDARRFRQELGLQGFQPPSEEQRQKLEDFRKSQDEKARKLLTADQQAKLKELTGAEFKGEIPNPFGGGRRPGGNRPGGGNRPPPPPAN